MAKLFEAVTEAGHLRVEKWPEGYVFWAGGRIVWKSWTALHEETATPSPAMEYPDDMPPALADALSLMNFQTGPIAHIFRAAGHNIPPKCEVEQAFVLHRCIKLALAHGEDWRKHAQAEINDIKAKLKPSDPKIEAQNG